MAGGPAAPEIVVVHGRKVVVDEGIVVDELERAGKRKEDAAAAAETGPGAEEEERPEPLSSRKDSVAHRSKEQGILLGEDAVEFPLDESFLGS
jgi:hypothetical protein